MRVRTRKRTGVKKFLRFFFLAVINRNYSDGEERNSEKKARAPPHRARETCLHAIAIARGNVPLRAAFFIHGTSITKERYEGVPHRHEQKQKRKRDVHEKPAVQPVLHAQLCISEAAFVTPAAHVINARSIHMINAAFQVMLNVV